MFATLDRYLMRRYLVWLAITATALGVVAFLFNFLEMAYFAGKRGYGNASAMELALLRFPRMAFDALPLIVLVASVLCLTRLSEARAFIVIRAAGVSVWRFLTPIALTAFCLGVLSLITLAPVGTSGFYAFENLKSELRGTEAQFSFSQNGVWLHETAPGATTVIRAARIAPDDRLALEDPTFFIFAYDGKLHRHITAARAILREGHWSLENAAITDTDNRTQNRAQVMHPTSITSGDLGHHLRRPETLNVWELPRYIAAARAAGAHISAHIVQFHGLLALPFLLVTMVFVAAAFGLPTGRQMPTARIIGATVMAGFSLYIFVAFTSKLAALDLLPALLASWSPPLIAMLLATTVLLVREDG